MDPDIAYACREYALPPGMRDWKVAMLFSDPPAMPRTGYLFPIEGERWMVGLMGAAGQHPPTDPDGFQAFARSLRHPVLADAIDRAEPLGPARAHRGTANRLLHYERVQMPDGLVVLGDAVCAFNPVYGQGISTAAVAAATLDRCLVASQRGGRVDRRRLAKGLSSSARAPHRGAVDALHGRGPALAHDHRDRGDT